MVLPTPLLPYQHFLPPMKYLRIQNRVGYPSLPYFSSIILPHATYF